MKRINLYLSQHRLYHELRWVLENWNLLEVQAVNIVVEVSDQCFEDLGDIEQEVEAAIERLEALDEYS